MSFTEKIKKIMRDPSRWIVAAIGIPIVIFAILTKIQFIFPLLVIIIGALLWWEFTSHFLGKDRLGLFFISITAWLIISILSYIYGIPGQQIGLTIALALGAIYSMWSLNNQANPVVVNILSRYALGHLYISFLFSFLLLMKKFENGERIIIYTIFITFVADTCAYYVGSFLKGPKIYPKISPNKTYSGLIGAILGAVVFSLIFNKFMPSNFSTTWLSMVILGIILAIWGHIGDFFESCLKRAVQIKDSSKMLLGHGGFLDRLDALLFNLPVVYFYASWILYQ